MFEIEKMETRVSRMITWLGGIQSKITDFIPGGKTRTKLEAVALELERQDYQVYRAVAKAIPLAIYRAFAFDLLPAVRASGYVTFTANTPPASNITIPVGTRVATISTPEKVYETTQTVVLLAGQSNINSLVSCTVPGASGNTGPTTITLIKTTISGIDAVTNAAGFGNGAEKETEEDRATRFRAYIDSISRGTAAAIRYGATTAKLTDVNGSILEQVVTAVVIEPTPPTGYVNCYIHNGSGGTSNDLVAEAQKVVDGYQDTAGTLVPGYSAAGIICNVAKATETPTNVVATLSIAGGDSSTVITTATDAASNYIASLGVGKELVRNELIERLMGIAGVYDVTMTVPAANIAPAGDAVLTVGTVAIT